MVNYKLSIELVPETSWYSNVRSKVSKQIWDIIRRKCYQNASYKCEICGDNGKNQGSNHPVDCHEIWHYDDITRVQKLIGFIALCPNCHLVKHPGFAQIKGKSELVVLQLMKVNSMTRNEAQLFIQDAFEIWTERSKFQWTLDITFIDNYIVKSIEQKESTIF